MKEEHWNCHYLMDIRLSLGLLQEKLKFSIQGKKTRCQNTIELMERMESFDL
jgi:hypothetical protein